MMDESNLNKYISLMNKFTRNEINASVFETSFLKLFKNEKINFKEDVYLLLNQLFQDVDAFCPDPHLRDRDDLSEDELLSSVKRTLAQLKKRDS